MAISHLAQPQSRVVRDLDRGDVRTGDDDYENGDLCWGRVIIRASDVINRVVLPGQ